MARGRMLNRKVATSLSMHRLPDDTCRLLATWLIPFLDKRGVYYADPAIVRSTVFPRRSDLSVDVVEQYMQAVEDEGMFITFEAEGQRWQFWPRFAENQIGLRDDREATDFPPPPAGIPARVQDDCPQNTSGSHPDNIRKSSREKTAEGNISEVEEEEKRREEYAPVTRDQPVTHANVTPQTARQPDASPSPSVVPEPEPKPKAKPAAKQSDNYRPIFGWLQSVCQVNAPARVGKAAKAIDDSGATLEACQHFGQWWVACDWRGQKGQSPTPEQVWSEWPKALAWDGRAPSTNGKRHNNDAAIREAMSDPRYIAEEAKRSGKLS